MMTVDFGVMLIGLKCFVLAIFYGLAPIGLGFIIGWIIRSESMGNHERLKNLVLRIYNKGKISDSEKDILLTSIQELRDEDFEDDGGNSR